MTSSRSIRRVARVGGLRSALLLVVAASVWSTSACSRAATADDDRLPGRSRPILQHDWPHPRDMPAAASTFAAPPAGAALVTTATGLRTFVVEDREAPLVRITAAMPLGRLYEREGEAGAAEVLARLLTRDRRSGAPLSEQLEDLGTRIDVEDDLDLTRLTLDVLPEDWRAGVTLMINLLRRPELDRAFIAAHRAGAGYVAVTASVAGHTFRPKVELERRLGGYPLAPVDAGTQVRNDAVAALAARTLRPDTIALGIGGAVPRSEVETLLRDLTAGWTPASDDRPGPLAAPRAAGAPAVHTIDDPSLEGWIAIGRPVGPVPDDQRPALAVLTEILNVRLNISAREIRGLANKTSFESPETANGTGLLLVRSGGRTEAVAPLIKYSLDEIARIASRHDRITDDELEIAKGILALGKWQGALEGALMAPGTYAVETVRFGTTDRLMRWPEAVLAVTADQVKEVAAAYLDRNAMATVVVGPLDRIREARHPRWPVALDDITGPAARAQAGVQ